MASVASVGLAGDPAGLLGGAQRHDLVGELAQRALRVIGERERAAGALVALQRRDRLRRLARGADADRERAGARRRGRCVEAYSATASTPRARSAVAIVSAAKREAAHPDQHDPVVAARSAAAGWRRSRRRARRASPARPARRRGIRRGSWRGIRGVGGGGEQAREAARGDVRPLRQHAVGVDGLAALSRQLERVQEAEVERWRGRRGRGGVGRCRSGRGGPRDSRRAPARGRPRSRRPGRPIRRAARRPSRRGRSSAAARRDRAAACRAGGGRRAGGWGRPRSR